MPRLGERLSGSRNIMAEWQIEPLRAAPDHAASSRAVTPLSIRFCATWLPNTKSAASDEPTSPSSRGKYVLLATTRWLPDRLT